MIHHTRAGVFARFLRTRAIHRLFRRKVLLESLAMLRRFDSPLENPYNPVLGDQRRLGHAHSRCDHHQGQ